MAVSLNNFPQDAPTASRWTESCRSTKMKKQGLQQMCLLLPVRYAGAAFECTYLDLGEVHFLKVILEKSI